VVSVGTGKPLTQEDMAKNAFLALTGFELGTWVAKGLKVAKVTDDVANTVGTAAIAGSVQTAIAERVKEEEQTGGFLAGFPTGLMEVMTLPGLKRGLADQIRVNGDLRYLANMKARERVAAETYADDAERIAATKQFEEEEIDAMAERMAGPIMQFVFGAGAAPAGDLVGQPIKPGDAPPTVTTPTGPGRPPVTPTR
jgi:hypothetical protein